MNVIFNWLVPGLIELSTPTLVHWSEIHHPWLTALSTRNVCQNYFNLNGVGLQKVPVLCGRGPPTYRCGGADGGGGQCGAEAVDSVVEMLSKENVVFHRLTGQSVQLLPPAKANFRFVLLTHLCIVTALWSLFSEDKAYLGWRRPTANRTTPASLSWAAACIALPWDFPSDKTMTIWAASLELRPPGKPFLSTYLSARPVWVLPPLAVQR